MTDNYNCGCECSVNCNVKRCTHHTKNNTCMAREIRVSNSNASTCGETCCETFQPRAEG